MRPARPAARYALAVLVPLVVAALLGAFFLRSGLPLPLKKIRQDGSTFLTAEPEFFRGFAREGLGAAVPFFRVAEPKPAGFLRAVLLGGAVATGFPMSDYHLGRMVEARWRARFPGEPVEVINLPGHAEDPALGRELADAALALDPDLLVVCLEGTWSFRNESGLRDVIRRAMEHETKVLLVVPPTGGAASDDRAPALAQRIADDSGSAVMFIDAGRRMRGWDPAPGESADFFLDDVHLAFSGRVALAELVVDGMAALRGLQPSDDSPSAVAAWWQKFAQAEAEARRDTFFTGYDEHDMWSLVMKRETDPDRLAALQEKVRGLRRRAVLGWDTTAIVVAYERAQLQNPHDPLTHFTAGRLLGLRGEGERAEEAFQRGFALQPERPDARLNHAAMQMTRGDTEAAHGSLGILENFDPQAEGLLKMKAALAMREAELPEAAALLEKHLARNPNDSEAWLTLSEIQLKLGDFAASEASEKKGKEAAR